MGTLYCFSFFDGRVEFVRDGGMGKHWVVEFAQKYFNIIDIWQVSSVNGIYSGTEFFSSISNKRNIMTISNLDDVIDSRDIIERIEELESELGDFLGENESNTEKDFSDIEELMALRDLANEASQYSADWEYGETLIRYSYWENYVQELLEDCGDIPKDLPWYIAIDWETTADNISQDYALVEFDGVDYYIRSI